MSNRHPCPECGSRAKKHTEQECDAQALDSRDLDLREIEEWDYGDFMDC